MKLRNLFLASAAIAGLFSACSNEMDEATDGGAQSKEEAYVSFAIQMPSSAATRAADEAGSDEESKVSEVTLLFFDKVSHNLVDIKNISTFNEGTTSNVYNTDAFTVTKGSRLIYAFANAQPAIKKFVTNDNGAAYKAITEGVGTDLASDLSANNKFTMSNAGVVKATDVNFKTEAAAIAAPVSIEVERTVAKIVYTGDTFAFPIKRPADGGKIGDVKLTDMTLINANKKYFYLRRVTSNADGSGAVIGGEEKDGTTYVVDPNFTQKVGDITSEYILDNFFANEAAYNKTIATNATFYCHENTMSQNGQYMGATTGVTFKAEVVVNGQQGAATFYRYNGQIYTTEKDVKTAANITANVTEWDVADWKDKGVDFYKDGICYYHYMIKHVDNNDPTTMGIMEFGVVRNNVYKLAVTSINEIGATTPDIKPENPDETEKAYIAVSITVKDWTVRSNENIGL